MANYVIKNERGDAVVREDEFTTGSWLRTTRRYVITRISPGSLAQFFIKLV
jgi:hypothetical protein